MNSTKLIYRPSGEVYKNRKEAKEQMGHGNFNRAMKNGDIVFITARAPFDII